MDTMNEKNLPIEATEKAITTGKIGKDNIDRAATKMCKQVKEVEKIREGKTNEEAKKVVEEAVNERTLENNKNMVK